MTTRSPALRRAAAWLLLALFAVVIGEPLRGHACPVHAALGALEASAGAGERHAPAGVGHGAHAPMQHAAGHTAGHMAGEAPADGGHGEQHRCDCLGTCSSVAPVQVAPSLTLHLVEVGILEAAAPLVPLVPVATSGDHVLPFANGPPTLA